jgi:hypothetical protein
MKKIIVFSTLAVNQTNFWLLVAQRLSASGISPAFVSFDDCSSDLIEKTVYPFLRISGPLNENANNQDHEVFKKFASNNPNLYVSHERLAFEIISSDKLCQKFSNYFQMVENFLSDLKSEGEVLVFQELGGFISVLSTFEAARSKAIDNYFIEPSFFRGRQFFIKNSLSSRRIEKCKVTSSTATKVKSVLATVITHKSIVVPDKDKHHYSSAKNKIFNLRNFTRFIQKLINIHLFGKYYEFGYPVKHAIKHLKMFINSIRHKRNYTSIDTIDNYVYFPLHVPGDAALTLRSPKFLDQLYLVDYVARNMPVG